MGKQPPRATVRGWRPPSTPTLAGATVALPANDPRSQTTIRLLKEADLPDTPVAAVFRYSAGTAALIAVLMLSGGAALIGVGRVQGNPLAYYLGGLLLLFLWIYQSVVLARFRPTNWLVRVTDQGLYIKFRSYLNHHFPDGDPAVMYVPFRAVRVTRVVRESQELPDTDRSGSLMHRHTIVEVELTDDAPELQGALAAERAAAAPKEARWYGSSASKHKHHPVRMPSPRTIALEWQVIPGVSSFLRMMAVHVPVESAKVIRDYTHLESLAPKEQESRVLELVEGGQFMDAVRVVRQLYGYGLTEAKNFVEDLSGRARA